MAAVAPEPEPAPERVPAQERAAQEPVTGPAWARRLASP